MRDRSAPNKIKLYDVSLEFGNGSARSDGALCFVWRRELGLKAE